MVRPGVLLAIGVQVKIKKILRKIDIKESQTSCSVHMGLSCEFWPVRSMQEVVKQ